jgi:hypothetical protein
MFSGAGPRELAVYFRFGSLSGEQELDISFFLNVLVVGLGLLFFQIVDSDRVSFVGHRLGKQLVQLSFQTPFAFELLDQTFGLRNN